MPQASTCWAGSISSQLLLVPTGGALPKGSEREAEAMTADFTKKLSPVRCAAQVKFHRQDAFRIPGWEDAIKRDLMRIRLMNTMHKRNRKWR